MLTLKATAVRLTQDSRAVTAVEYALIAGLLAVVIIGSVTTLGSKTTAVFQKISSSVSSA
jgi:pilus assembly protein Flp/PilA